MDISKVLEQLRKELLHLNAAIVSLERLQQKGVRRGRPPKTQGELDVVRTTLHSASGVRRHVRRGGATE